MLRAVDNREARLTAGSTATEDAAILLVAMLCRWSSLSLRRPCQPSGFFRLLAGALCRVGLRWDKMLRLAPAGMCWCKYGLHWLAWKVCRMPAYVSHAAFLLCKTLESWLAWLSQLGSDYRWAYLAPRAANAHHRAHRR